MADTSELALDDFWYLFFSTVIALLSLILFCACCCGCACGAFYKKCWPGFNRKLMKNRPRPSQVDPGVASAAIDAAEAGSKSCDTAPSSKRSSSEDARMADIREVELVAPARVS
eukprot:TRINITY_DN24993_c0_g1_i1.p3 TRINITY_DN24993_c0_g1~~TRINITY_DN24993_c0_g1_i1.p3  ORF type:complete len:114 (+),score=28.71 TRINITY_DN24993_c0_g1_i1:89-430(+)